MVSENTKDILRPWKNIGADVPRVLVVKAIVVRKSLGPKGPCGFESRSRHTRWGEISSGSRGWLKAIRWEDDESSNNLVYILIFYILHLLYKILEVLFGKERVEATPKATNKKEGTLNKISARRNAQMVSPFYIIFYINISRAQSLKTLCGMRELNRFI